MSVGEKMEVRAWLGDCRDKLRESAKRKRFVALDLLECEVAEAVDAIYFKRKEEAVDEIYDAVAVLMRMAEMVEGKTLSGKTRSFTKRENNK